jgi:hypothetical protein
MQQQTETAHKFGGNVTKAQFIRLAIALCLGTLVECEQAGRKHYCSPLLLLPAWLLADLPFVVVPSGSVCLLAGYDFTGVYGNRSCKAHSGLPASSRQQ